MTTSSASQVFGGSVPIGAIVQGQYAADTSYLPCDGGDYLKATYPRLDTTLLETFGSNTVTARSLARTGQTSVAFGNGIFVAITSGTANYSTSTDGVTWTARTLPGALTANGGGSLVAFGNGVFVAMGYNNLTAYTSADGINWTARTLTAPSTAYWGKVVYAGSLFFILPNWGSANGQILTSADGVTWTLRSTGIGASMWDVTYANGLYIAALSHASGPTTSAVYGMSVDGISWAAGGLQNFAGVSMSANWGSVAYFNGRFIFLPESGIPRLSADGSVFALAPGLVGSWSTMRVFGGRLFLFGSNSATSVGNIAVTTDLMTWKIYTGPQTEGVRDAAYGNNVLVLGNYGVVGTVNGVASLAIDTTKFRTPNMPKLGDGDRFYIRVK